MSFLQQFFQEVFSHQAPVLSSGTKESLQAQFETAQIGDFEFTDAVRPSLNMPVKPTEGYRHEVYVDEESQLKVPVVMASVSRDKLFPLFMQLVSQLGESVDVVLETSHDHAVSGHVDLYREHIDLPVLTSILWEYEDLLTNDGCTGIAVLNPAIPQEVQFDEHKLLIMYGSPLEKFEFTLEQNNVQLNPSLQFITEAEHVHSSNHRYQRQFEELRLRLGTCRDAESHDEHGRDPEDDWFEGCA